MLVHKCYPSSIQQLAVYVIYVPEGLFSHEEEWRGRCQSIIFSDQ